MAAMTPRTMPTIAPESSPLLPPPPPPPPPPLELLSTTTVVVACLAVRRRDRGLGRVVVGGIFSVCVCVCIVLCHEVCQVALGELRCVRCRTTR